MDVLDSMIYDIKEQINDSDGDGFEATRGGVEGPLETMGRDEVLEFTVRNWEGGDLKEGAVGVDSKEGGEGVDSKEGGEEGDGRSSFLRRESVRAQLGLESESVDDLTWRARSSVRSRDVGGVKVDGGGDDIAVKQPERSSAEVQASEQNLGGVEIVEPVNPPSKTETLPHSSSPQPPPPIPPPPQNPPTPTEPYTTIREVTPSTTTNTTTQPRPDASMETRVKRYLATFEKDYDTEVKSHNTSPVIENQSTLEDSEKSTDTQFHKAEIDVPYPEMRSTVTGSRIVEVVDEVEGDVVLEDSREAPTGTGTQFGGQFLSESGFVVTVVGSDDSFGVALPLVAEQTSRIVEIVEDDEGGMGGGEPSAAGSSSVVEVVNAQSPLGSFVVGNSRIVEIVDDDEGRAGFGRTWVVENSGIVESVEDDDGGEGAGGSAAVGNANEGLGCVVGEEVFGPTKETAGRQDSEMESENARGSEDVDSVRKEEEVQFGRNAGAEVEGGDLICGEPSGGLDGEGINRLFA
ncbi:hypothetical protein HK097_005504 [Rhizophlyctis rosea]|uniref:Uncharacterized protein n=1 Tax=Rhizophlyctis rosea TaxID=64517 RepID=A0AAD5S225_9FUNG|nr:hypothetical protein HK097_005504 [Rhizophlyctis rosea]